MITTSSCEIAFPFAQELAEKGLVATAKPNTMLSELNRTVLSDTLFGGNTTSVTNTGDTSSKMDDIVGIVSSVLVGSTTGSIDRASMHDQIQDTSVGLLTKAVLNHVSFARNVVNPIVSDYTRLVKDAMHNSKGSMPSEEFCIDQLEYPEVIWDTSFVSTLETYRGRTPVAPTSQWNIPLKAIVDLSENLATGDKDTDKMVGVWMANRDPDYIRAIIDFFFYGGTSEVCERFKHKLVQMADFKSLSLFDRIDQSLAIYLFAEKAYDVSALEEGTRMSLASYRSAVADIRDYAGAVLMASIDSAEKTKKVSSLVVAFDDDCKTITVNAENYRKWLNEGGSPEVLLGVMVSGRKVYTQSLIDAQTDYFKREWKNYCLIHDTGKTNRDFVAFKDILRFKFREIMAGLTERELEYVKTHSDYHESANTKLEGIIDSLKFSDMTDIDMLALKIICRCRFHYTDAELILTDINEAKLVNPDIRDAREAALIAVMNYVADFVADMINITDKI